MDLSTSSYGFLGVWDYEKYLILDQSLEPGNLADFFPLRNMDHYKSYASNYVNSD